MDRTNVARGSGGFTLVEVAVVLVIAGVMFLVLGGALTGVTVRTNKELVSSVATKVASAKVHEALATTYIFLPLTDSEYLEPETATFVNEDGTRESVTFGIERRVIVAPSQEGASELKQVEFRVFWPETAPDDPAGEVITSVQVAP